MTVKSNPGASMHLSLNVAKMLQPHASLATASRCKYEKISWSQKQTLGKLIKDLFPAVTQIQYAIIDPKIPTVHVSS